MKRLTIVVGMILAALPAARGWDKGKVMLWDRATGRQTVLDCETPAADIRSWLNLGPPDARRLVADPEDNGYVELTWRLETGTFRISYRQDNDHMRFVTTDGSRFVLNGLLPDMTGEQVADRAGPPVASAPEPGGLSWITRDFLILVFREDRLTRMTWSGRGAWWNHVDPLRPDTSDSGM